MSQSLEERLRANSNAFDGLLSLIPAKYYYDEKTQDQWKAKKKSKMQMKEDKLKKLDPEQQNDETGTALDVLKKREKSAKPARLPGQALRSTRITITSEDNSEEEGEEEEGEEEDGKDVEKAPIHVQVEESEDVSDNESINVIFDDEGNKIELNDSQSNMDKADDDEGGDMDKDKDKGKDKKDESENEAKLQKQKNLELLRAKLQAKIQNMRNKRKAPGTNVDGAPVSREAILLQRKRKQELKQQRKLQDLDNSDSNSESDTDDENDLDIESGPMAKKLKKDTKNKEEDETANADGIMYQSIMFNDGVRTTSDLQRLRKSNQGKKKGPSKHDYKAQLKILEQRKQKLQSKDELEQVKTIEKNKWQKAMLQAEGVKLKDDEKLIKKAIKRKEAKKRKSAIEWNERKRAVEINKQERAKRREENLRIRKENKGVKGSKQQRMKRKFKSIITPKKRAGFEGRLKRK